MRLELIVYILAMVHALLLATNFPSPPPSLSYVHGLCLKLGLKSKSTGKGLSRFLTVSKPVVNVALQGGDPKLILRPTVSQALEEYFQFLPITGMEMRWLNGEKMVKDGNVVERKPPKKKNRKHGMPVTTNPIVYKPPPPVAPSRKKLPIWEHREEILNTIRNNDVTVLSGSTGSGKSSTLTFKWRIFYTATNLPILLNTQPKSCNLF